MKPFAFVQFRRNSAIREQERRHLLDKCALERQDVLSFDALSQDLSSLNLDHYEGFFFGGCSVASVLKNDETMQTIMKNITPLLRKIVKEDKPTLFICFGLQFLGKMLGVPVVEGKEIGTMQVELTPEGKEDPLFQNIPSSFYVQTGHNEAITQVPQGTVELVRNGSAIVQGYRIKKHVYCFQFHPDQNEEDYLERICMYPQYDTNGQTTQPSPDANKIVDNFVKVSMVRNQRN